MLGTFAVSARLSLIFEEEKKKNGLNRSVFFLIAKYKILHLKLCLKSSNFIVRNILCLLSVRRHWRHRTEWACDMNQTSKKISEKTIIIKWSECIGFNVNGSGFCHTEEKKRSYASTHALISTSTSLSSSPLPSSSCSYGWMFAC